MENSYICRVKYEYFMVLANAVIDFLENLDISLFLSINEKHNGFFDQFMYAFSGKVVWVPMYISIV